MRVLLRKWSRRAPPARQDRNYLAAIAPHWQPPLVQAGAMMQTRFGIVVTVRALNGERSTRLLAVHFDKREEAEAVVRQLADVRGAEFKAVPLEWNSPVKS
jgi:hypothetical protein